METYIDTGDREHLLASFIFSGKVVQHFCFEITNPVSDCLVGWRYQADEQLPVGVIENSFTR